MAPFRPWSRYFTFVVAWSLVACLGGACQRQAADETKPPATATAVDDDPVPELPEPATLPASPAQIAGLCAWYDAADFAKAPGGAGTVWRDKSGNKKDLLQGESKYSPTQRTGQLAGLPVVSFSGKDQILSRPDLLKAAAKGLSVVMVARVHKAVGYDAFFSLGNYGTGDPDHLTICLDGGSVAGDSKGGRITSSSASLVDAGFKILTVQWDLQQGLCRVFENGMPTKSGTCSKGVSLDQGLFVGGFCGFKSFIAADIAEMLLLDHPLTDSERAGLHAYLAGKFKLDFSRRITPLAAKLPFAYYPSTGQVEVAADAAAWGLVPQAVAGKSVKVEVLPAGTTAPVATADIPLNPAGRGQTIFSVGDLKDGTYNVRFTLEGVAKVSGKTFERIHFPWENCDLGLDHTIYAPFEPVSVKGQQVQVVGRTMQANGFGLFDSIQCEGQEILAAPIRLEGTAGGKPIRWHLKAPSLSAPHPDLATIDAQATAGALGLRTRTSIEEDGCAKVEVELSPRGKRADVDSLWVEIPLKDEQVPLFHYAIAQELRNNYGGVLPRGGKVVWDVKTMVGCPATFQVQDGPADGIVWDSTKFKTWPRRETSATFVPYIWLGGVTRGLAWFGENTRGYEIDNASPVQVIHRQGNKVILRVHLVQMPVSLTAPRKIVFGLHPSPTKPLASDWRTLDIPGGWECVTPWGGYYCSSKYPDGRDFKITEKIVEGALTGKWDEKYFDEKEKTRERKTEKVQGSQNWLEIVKRLAGNAANSTLCAGRPMPLCTYFEEHFTETSYPEWKVFQDEWSEAEFSRFNRSTAGWGNYPQSYRNFVAYYGNEWLRRGAGLYFDNCCPKFSDNPRSSAAFAMPDGSIQYATTLWDTRQYYKRMWKLVQHWNQQKVVPYPLHLYLHMTNTQVLPYTTWSTILLDQEQVYRRDDKHMPPWPSEYLQAVTLSRTAGSIPTALNPLRNGLTHETVWTKPTPQMTLANWGMHTVHEIYGSGLNPGTPLSARYNWAWIEFGYRLPGAKVHNFWDPKSPLQVQGEQVKWVAQERDGRAILVLQSYSRQAVEAVVRWPGAVAVVDYEDHKRLTVDKDGLCRVSLGGEYGTRMLMVWLGTSAVPAAPPAKALFAEDFEFGLHAPVQPMHPCFRIIRDEAAKGNFVLRMLPDKNRQNFTLQDDKQLQSTQYELSFRIRVPALPKDRNRNGLLHVIYGTDAAKLTYEYALDLDTHEGQTTWVITKPFQAGNGQMITMPAKIATDLTSDLHARGPRRPELGKPDTSWHRVTIRVQGTQQTILLDDKKVFEATAPAELTPKGFTIGSSWDQIPGTQRVPYVELDDIRLLDLTK